MAINTIVGGTAGVHMVVNYVADTLAEMEADVLANPGLYSEKTFKAIDTELFYYVDAGGNIIAGADGLDPGKSAADGPADLSSGAVTFDVTVNQNNCDPNGNDTTDGISILKFTNSTGNTMNIFGLVAPSTAKTMVIYNEGPNTVRLRNNHANGDIDNRFDLNSNINLGQKEGAWLFYDTALQKWKILNI